MMRLIGHADFLRCANVRSIGRACYYVMNECQILWSQFVMFYDIDRLLQMNKEPTLQIRTILKTFFLATGETVQSLMGSISIMI